MGLVPPDDEDAQRRALRVVLHRYDQGAETAEQALVVLQALGLRDTPPAEPARPALSTRQRRQAARRAARAQEEAS